MLEFQHCALIAGVHLICLINSIWKLYVIRCILGLTSHNINKPVMYIVNIVFQVFAGTKVSVAFPPSNTSAVDNMWTISMVNVTRMASSVSWKTRLPHPLGKPKRTKRTNCRGPGCWKLCHRLNCHNQESSVGRGVKAKFILWLDPRSCTQNIYFSSVSKTTIKNSHLSGRKVSL